MLHVLLPFCPNDYKAAIDSLRWDLELGGCKGHKVTLMPAQSIEDFEEAKSLAEQCFDSVDILRDGIGEVGWPEGPNSMMRQAAWHFFIRKEGPWMWREPDLIFLVPGALDTAEREYLSSGKSFWGERVIPRDGSAHYLSGNMILPWDAVSRAPRLVQTVLARDKKELPFDVAASGEILADCHETKLLQHIESTGKPKSDKMSLQMLRLSAAMFHRSKDGALIELLKQQRGGTIQVPSSKERFDRLNPEWENATHELGNDGIPKPRENETLSSRKLTPDELREAREAYWKRREAELCARIGKLEALIVRNGITEEFCNPDGLKSKKPKRTAAEQAAIDARMEKVRAAKLAKK